MVLKIQDVLQNSSSALQFSKIYVFCDGCPFFSIAWGLPPYNSLLACVNHCLLSLEQHVRTTKTGKMEEMMEEPVICFISEWEYTTHTLWGGERGGIQE
jgi:hypothetical protein